MNPPKPFARRALAVAASALIGAVGAVAVAGPAAAHHPIISGNTGCAAADGSWQVIWSVGNSQADKTATIVQVSPEGVPNITNGTVLPMAGQGEQTGVQVLTKDDASASLAVTLRWSVGDQWLDKSAEATVTRPDPCPVPEQPPVEQPPAEEPPAEEPPAEEPPAAEEPQAEEPPAEEPPADGTGGSLPLTGDATGGLVAGAALLLAAGGALFVLARRRRRLTFTA